MTLTALLAMLMIAIVALPVTALAAMLWGAVHSAGLGDVMPDERLLAAIRGEGHAAGGGLWT